MTVIHQCECSICQQFESHPDQEQHQQMSQQSNKCFICGKPGHWARNCPLKAKSKTLNTIDVAEDWQEILTDDSLHTTYMEFIEKDFDVSSRCPL